MSFGHDREGGIKSPTAYGWEGPTGTEDGRGSAPGGLQPQFWDALVSFLAHECGLALTAANYDDYFTDTFRSLAVQEDLYDDKPGLAARPGTSIHGLGLAVDWDNSRKDWGAIQARLRAAGAKYRIIHPFDNPNREEWHWALDPAAFRTPDKEDTVVLVTVTCPTRAKANEVNLSAKDAGASDWRFGRDHQQVVGTITNTPFTDSESLWPSVAASEGFVAKWRGRGLPVRVVVAEGGRFARD